MSSSAKLSHGPAAAIMIRGHRRSNSEKFRPRVMYCLLLFFLCGLTLQRPGVEQYRMFILGCQNVNMTANVSRTYVDCTQSFQRPKAWSSRVWYVSSRIPCHHHLHYYCCLAVSVSAAQPNTSRTPCKAAITYICSVDGSSVTFFVRARSLRRLSLCGAADVDVDRGTNAAVGAFADHTTAALQPRALAGMY